MAAPIIHGPAYSTYVRTARLALEEKGVGYEIVHVGMLEGEHQQKPFIDKNPYGKVPAFTHDGMTLYETNVMTRYIDRAFPGPALQPADPVSLARMDQIISIADSFGYGCIMGKLVWQRIVMPMVGGTPDDAIVAESMAPIRVTLSEFARILGDGPWFAGAAISLADLHMAPIFGYFTSTAESGELLAPHGNLRAWWARMSARDSMAKTKP
jgi:glutathione S-transferase